MEPEGALMFSWRTDTCPCAKPNQTSHLFDIPFHIFLHTRLCFWIVLFFQIFLSKFRMQFSYPSRDLYTPSISSSLIVPL